MKSSRPKNRKTKRLGLGSIAVALPLSVTAQVTSYTEDQVFSAQRVAQASGSQVVNGNGAILDGNGKSGYFVQGGTLQINNATLMNFAAVGGDGSGGGAGMGGAVFVNDGATVILNNVNLLNNQAEGGEGGVGSYGGSLNGRFQGGSSAAKGAHGQDADSLSVSIFGITVGTAFFDGGNGRGGYNGGLGANSSAGFGGAGGSGGDGASGQVITLENLKAAYEIADAAFKTAEDSTEFGIYTALSGEFSGLAVAAAAGFNVGGPTTTHLAPLFGAAAATFATEAGKAGAAIVKDGVDIVFMAAQLIATEVFNYQMGSKGLGGDGGTGGAAGSSGFGFGGAPGGAGGDGGDSVDFGSAIGGAGGDGGNGGLGGFGAGGGIGGAGGDGGSSASGLVISSFNGVAAGNGGAGGYAGFGGGMGAQGSSASGGNPYLDSGGNGGNGLGGAIFVRKGGTLIVQGNALFDGNAVRGGNGQVGDLSAYANGESGVGVGSDIYVMTGGSVVLDAGTGNTITFNGNPYGTGIADDSASSMIPAGATSPIASGKGADVTIRSGLVVFNGANVYSGVTKLEGGVLQDTNQEGVYWDSKIQFNGGVYQTSGEFTRYTGVDSTQVEWIGSGGFAAGGGDGADLTVRLNNGLGLTWGAGSFVPAGSKLLFGSTSADGDVYFKNAINLAGGNRTILNTATLVLDAEGHPIENAVYLDGVLSNGAATFGDATHTGVVVLTANNTYAGGTTIGGGTLRIANGGSLNANGAVSIASNATFDLTETDQTIGSLSGAGYVVLDDSDLTLNQSADGVFSGVISGSDDASLIKQGSAKLTLTGANTYTGLTHVKAGTLDVVGTLDSKTLQVDSGAVLDSKTGGLSSLAELSNDGTVNLGAANDTIKSYTSTGTLNGTATLTAETYALDNGSVVNAHLGTGTVTANGTVALNGTSNAETFTVRTGTTTLGSAERLRDDTDLTISSGARLVLGGDEKIGSLLGSGFLANNGGRLTVDDGSFAGVISGSGGLTKVSADKLVLTGANTYSGSTLVDAGTLELSGAGSLTSNVVNVASGAKLADLNSGLASDTALTNAGTVDIGSADDTIATYAGTGKLDGTSTLTAASYALNNGSEINANLGTGVVNANGAVALNGTSNAETVNIQSGVTTLGSAERLRDDTDLTISGGATLVLGGAEKIGTLNGAGTTSLLGHRLTVDDGGYSGSLTGTGGLTKVSTGTLTLSGASTYTGATDVNAGTVTLTGSLASQSVNVAATATLNNVNGGLASDSTLTNAGTVNLSADDTITTFNSTGTLNGAGRTLGAATYNLNEGSVINANLGTGVVNANGSVALNGTSNAETVNIQTGTTTLGSAERLRDDTDLTLSGGATLVLGGNEKIGTLDGAGLLQNSGGRLTVDDGDFSGVVAGTGGLTKVSTGTLTLSGANTYEGSTLVDAGTVNLAGSLVSNVVTVATPATLNISDSGLAADTVLTVDGVATFTSDDQVATLNGAASGLINLDDFSELTVENGLYAGVIAGTGDLTKVSSSTLTLTGASTYTGVTNVDAGTLTLVGSLKSPEVNVAVDAVLNDVNGGLDAASTLNNDGTVNLSASDTITTFNNTGTLNGAGRTLTAATYNLDTDSLINANLGTGVVNANGTVRLNGTSDAETVNVRSGTTTLGSAERLRDDTDLTVSTGATLVLGGDEKIGSLFGAGLVANSGGRLTVDDGAFSGVLSGTGGLTKVSGGELTLSGANTYTGSTLLTAGSTVLSGSLVSDVVNVSAGASLASTAGGLADDADVTVDGTATLTAADKIETLLGSGSLVLDAARLSVDQGFFSGVVSGTGGLTKISSGELELSGANTYTGDTIVSAGELTLTGSLVATGLTIDSGATLTDANGGLASGTVATVNGTLALQSDDAIHSLLGSGNVDLATSRLTLDAGDFSGVISDDNGAGTLVKVSAETLKLTGASDYTGTTLVQAGTLRLEGSLASKSVDVDSGANLTVTDGGLASDAALVNDGTVLLGADDTIGSYVGGGTLDTFGSATPLLGAAMTPAPRLSKSVSARLQTPTLAALVFAEPIRPTLTAASYILQDGSVIKVNLGAGALTVTGAAELFGTSASLNIDITETGTLTLAAAEHLSDEASVNVDGALVLTGGDETIKSLSGSGLVDFKGHKFIVTDGGDFSGTLDAAGTDLTLGGATTLGGDTVAKKVNIADGGALTLIDGAALKADTVTLGGGSTLFVSDSDRVTFGTLDGSGRVESPVFRNRPNQRIEGNLTFSGDLDNHGILAPGGIHAIGTTRIEGSYTEAGRLEIQIGGRGAAGTFGGYDQVLVSDGVTLQSGSVLVIQGFNRYQPGRGQVFQIFADMEGDPLELTGQFTGVRFDPDGAGGAAPVANAAVVFDRATGRVITTGLNNRTSTFADLGKTTNQRRAAQALFATATKESGDRQIDTRRDSGRFALALINRSLTSGNYNGPSPAEIDPDAPAVRVRSSNYVHASRGVQAALDAGAGPTDADFYGSLVDYAALGEQALLRRLGDRVSALSAAPDAPAGAFAGHLSANVETVDGTDLNRNDYYAGYDMPFGHGLRVGVLVAVSEGDADEFGGESEVDGLLGHLYATKTFTSRLGGYASVGYGDYDYDADRAAFFDIVKGETDGRSLGAAAGVDYLALRKKDFEIVTRGGLRYIYSGIDGFTEEGAAGVGAQEVDDLSSQTLSLDLGASAVWTFRVGGRALQVELSANIDAPLYDHQDDVRAVFVDTGTTYVNSFEDEEISASLGLNLGYALWKDGTIYAGYEGKVGGNQGGYTNLGLRISF